MIIDTEHMVRHMIQLPHESLADNTGYLVDYQGSRSDLFVVSPAIEAQVL